MCALFGPSLWGLECRVGLFFKSYNSTYMFLKLKPFALQFAAVRFWGENGSCSPHLSLFKEVII